MDPPKEKKICPKPEETSDTSIPKPRKKCPPKPEETSDTSIPKTRKKIPKRDPIPSKCDPKPLLRSADRENPNCYEFHKHPSAKSTPYKGRVCCDPDKYKKKCPSPIEICKDPNLDDPCAPKKKRRSVVSIDEDFPIPERSKPPRCPSKEDPCINDNKPKIVIPPVKEYTCDPLSIDKNPCADSDPE